MLDRVHCLGSASPPAATGLQRPEALLRPSDDCDATRQKCIETEIDRVRVANRKLGTSHLEEATGPGRCDLRRAGNDEGEDG